MNGHAMKINVPFGAGTKLHFMLFDKRNWLRQQMYTHTHSEWVHIKIDFEYFSLSENGYKWRYISMALPTIGYDYSGYDSDYYLEWIAHGRNGYIFKQK